MLTDDIGMNESSRHLIAVLLRRRMLSLVSHIRYGEYPSY